MTVAWPCLLMISSLVARPRRRCRHYYEEESVSSFLAFFFSSPWLASVASVQHCLKYPFLRLLNILPYSNRSFSFSQDQLQRSSPPSLLSFASSTSQVHIVMRSLRYFPFVLYASCFVLFRYSCFTNVFSCRRMVLLRFLLKLLFLGLLSFFVPSTRGLEHPGFIFKFVTPPGIDQGY